MGRQHSTYSPRQGVLLRLAWLVKLASAQQSIKFPPDATPTNFQGFVTNPPGLITTYLCDPGTTHTTFSSWAGCCAVNENCEYFTKCDAGTATRIDGSTYICSGTLPNCYTMTIYASYPFAVDRWLKIGCVQPGFNAHTAYREIVVTQTTSGSAAIPDNTGSSTSQPSQTGTSSPGQGATESQATTSSSQAWIAGAVVGPLVAVALAGFAAFWLGKRRGRKRDSGPAEKGDGGDGVSTTERAEAPPGEPAMLHSPPSTVLLKSPGDSAFVTELPDTKPLELDSVAIPSSDGTQDYQRGRAG